MSEEGSRASRSASDAASDSAAVVRAILVLYRRRRLILGVTLGSVFVVGLLCVLVWDKYYEASATVLAPQEGSTDMASAVALSGVVQSFSGLTIPSLTPRLDLFENVLESRRVFERVVEKHDLVEQYDAGDVSAAIVELRRHTSIVAAQEGVITVKVEATDPELSASLANSFVTQLDQVLAEFKTSDAGYQSKFITKQIDKTRRELEVAENTLLEFREGNKLISLDDQARGSAESIRALRMEIGRYEAELLAWRKELPLSNPGLQRLENLLTEKRRQVNELQYGEKVGVVQQKRSHDGAVEEIYVPIAHFPHLGLDLSRLQRDVAMKEKVFALLLQELEKARIAEARDLPEVRQLDIAVPAIRKARPQTLINLAITGVTAFLFGVLLTFCLEVVERWRPHFRRELSVGAAAEAPDEPRAEPSLVVDGGPGVVIVDQAEGPSVDVDPEKSREKKSVT